MGFKKIKRNILKFSNKTDLKHLISQCTDFDGHIRPLAMQCGRAFAHQIAAPQLAGVHHKFGQFLHPGMGEAFPTEENLGKN